MNEEKRAFSRVPIRLKAYARKTQSTESLPLFTGDAINEKPTKDALFRNAKLPEDLMNFLFELDRKLDNVLGLLSQDHLRSDFPLDIEVTELSAAGIRFRSKDVFKQDDTLEIVLLMSLVPLRMAGSKGKILAYEDGLYRFEFVGTRGSDKEAIVQFVFQQQREQIRNSKM